MTKQIYMRVNLIMKFRKLVIKRPTNSTTSTTSGQTSTTGGQIDTTSGRASTTSRQKNEQKSITRG